MNIKQIGGVAALSLGAALMGASTVNAAGPDFILSPALRQKYYVDTTLEFSVKKADGSDLDAGWTVSYDYDGMDCNMMLFNMQSDGPDFNDAFEDQGICKITISVSDGVNTSSQEYTIESGIPTATDVTIEQTAITLVAGTDGVITLDYPDGFPVDTLVFTIPSEEFVSKEVDGKRITIRAKKATPDGAPVTLTVAHQTTGAQIGTATITVTSLAPEMTKQNLSIKVGESVDLTTALSFPADVRDDAKGIAFALNDPADASKAAIAADGKTLSGLDAGTVVIRATLFDGSELTFEVEIEPVVNDFEVSNITLGENETETISLIARPDGTVIDFGDVTVSDIDNDDVVEVLTGPNGIAVRGLKAGIAKLKIALALSNGSSVEHDITVTVEEPVVPPTPGQGDDDENNEGDDEDEGDDDESNEGDDEDEGEDLPTPPAGATDENPNTGDGVIGAIVGTIASLCGLIASVFIAKKD